MLVSDYKIEGNHTVPTKGYNALGPK